MIVTLCVGLLDTWYYLEQCQLVGNGLHFHIQDCKQVKPTKSTWQATISQPSLQPLSNDDCEFCSSHGDDRGV